MPWNSPVCVMPEDHIFAAFNTTGISKVTPYQEENSSKKEQVTRMFDRIARHYDLLNHVLSLGIDIRWRKKAVRKLADLKPLKVLDVASGTGDLAFMAARAYPDAHVTGVDIAEKMLDIAKVKAERKGLGKRVQFAPGDSENLLFPDNSYDAVTVAFGVRNFEDLQKGLTEMYRVVRPGGKVVILEFSKPRTFPFKQMFGLYFKYLLPFVGSLQSKDKRAYHYLYESVQAFPDYDRFCNELLKAGWKQPQYNVLSLGICAIYTACK